MVLKFPGDLKAFLYTTTLTLIILKVPSSTYIPYDDGKAAATYCCRNIQGCLRIIGTSKVALSEVLLMQYVNFFR